MEEKITTPILLIAFNRPDTTSVVFEYIKRAKPTKLYIALDGARANKPYEDIVCNAVKDIVERVDWDCEVHYKINDSNKGAEITVSQAIRWVFEREEYAIILEDDIVAPLSFFKFAQEMLVKYKDDENIASITSNNFTPMPTPNGDDYFFAKYGHSWGWATWRRVFSDFDLDMKVNQEHCNLSYLQTITNSIEEAKYYQKIFFNIIKKGVGNSTWDNIGLYKHRINQSLSIIPSVNLSSNIGVVGLHARGQVDTHYRTFDEGFVVKQHPEKVVCYDDYDKYHFIKHIYKKKYFYKRVLKKINLLLSRIA